MPITVINPTITDIGRAAAINAAGTGIQLTITHISLGTGQYTPSVDQDGMAGRVETVAIGGGSTDGIGGLRISARFPATQAAYVATEIGFWAGNPDAGGVLFAVWSHPSDIVTSRTNIDYVAGFGLKLSQVPHGSITVNVDINSPLALSLLASHEGASDPHGQYATKDGVQRQAYTASPPSGSGSAYSMAPFPPVRAVETFHRFHVVFALANSVTNPTLSVSGLPPAPLKVYDQTGVKVDPDIGALAEGMHADVVFDGQDWVVFTPLPSAVHAIITPSMVSSAPEFTGGSGEFDSHFVVPAATSAPGATGVLVATITVTGLRPGEYIPIADLADVENGGRYSFSNRFVNGAGNLVFDIRFNDIPSSPVGTVHKLKLKLGGRTVYIGHDRAIAITVTSATPSITSPASGATGIRLPVQVTTSAYAALGGVDTHASTDWEVATNAGFTTIVAQSLADTVNKVAWTIPAGLAYTTTYFVRARHRGAASGPSNWSPTVSFVTQNAISVNPPSITAPSVLNNVPVGQEFSTSTFATTGGADVHTSSDWQIATDAGFANVVRSTASDTQSKTAWVPAPALSNATTYFARVRHRGATAGVSAYSDTVTFTTVPAAAITAPTITAPTSGQIGFTGAAASSAFAVTNGSDTHSSSDWQVATDAGFSNIVASVTASSANKTTWTPTGLTPGAFYHLRVRHLGSTLGASAYSAAVSFTALKVNAPSITSPAANAAGVSPTATVTASAYSVNGTDSHASTDWQVAANSTFTTIVASSASDAVNLTSWQLPSGLAPSTTYYLRARYRSATGVVSDYSVTAAFTTSAAPVTVTPSITSPAGGTISSVSPTFTTSAFGVSSGSDTHLNSDWQIATDAGFSNVVRSTLADTTNKTSWAVPQALNPATAYFVRVRHRGAASGASAYSATLSITTPAAPAVSAPSITAPTAGATGFVGPFRTSAFVVTNGSDTHASTEWQVATDAGFTNVVASANSFSEKTSWPIPAALTGGAAYFVRARHAGTALGFSAYSASVQFTLVSITAPTITAPTSGQTGVSPTASITSSAFASNGGDTHASSDWQVATSSGFTTIVAQSTGDATNKTAWVPSGLAPSTTYFVRVRHRGASGVVSGYSTGISFTTSAQTGVSWVERSFGANGIYGLTYGNGMFVAVGHGPSSSNVGEIFTSPDGINWTKRTVPNTAGVLTCVIWTGTRFLAGGYNNAVTDSAGVILTSTNGITWTQVASTGGAIWSLAYDGVVHLAGGLAGTSSRGLLMRSTDGSAWTTVSGFPGGHIEDMTYVASLDLFVAVGYTTSGLTSEGGLFTSPDGATWTRRATPAVGALQCVTWSGTKFVVGGRRSTGSAGAGAVLTSGDGLNWTSQTFSSGAMMAVLWSNGQFVGVGNTTAGTDAAGAAYTSPDGTTWTVRTTGSGMVQCIATNGTTLVTGGFGTSGSHYEGRIYTSN